jgi:hypothetical protein
VSDFSVQHREMPQGQPPRQKQRVEPKSLDDALELKDNLAKEVMAIQTQLADRNKQKPDGRRMRSNDYWDWKQKALVELGHKVDELRAVKEWIRKTRQARTLNPQDAPLSFDPSDPVSLLTASYRLFKRLMAEGVDFEEDEKTVVTAVQAYLDHEA